MLSRNVEAFLSKEQEPVSQKSSALQNRFYALPASVGQECLLKSDGMSTLNLSDHVQLNLAELGDNDKTEVACTYDSVGYLSRQLSDTLSVRIVQTSNVS